MTQLVMAFGAALVLALALTPVMRRLAERFRLLDHADGQRKLHPQPIPLGGGVVLLFALVAVTGLIYSADAFAWQPAPPYLSLPAALLSSAVLMCAVGCCDDLKGLRVRWKLLGQVSATLPLVLAGHRFEQLEIGGYAIELGWWAIPLSIGWLITGANALNFVDGVDGLASTIGVAVACTTGLIAHHLGHAEVAVLAAVLAGGLSGFIFYNWQPATIYLGDAGSMVIGLWLAALALSGTQEPVVGTRLVVLVALLSVPIADIGLAVVRRILSGQQFWLADRSHIHHRLLECGLTVPKTVQLMAGICLLSGSAAFAAAVHGRELLAWGGLAVLATGMVRSRCVGHYEVELVGQIFAGSVLNLFARFSSGRFTRGLPTLAELEQMHPATAWASFVAELELHAVERLELTFCDPRGVHGRHEWESPRSLQPMAERWTLEAACDSPANGWCRLRAMLPEGRGTHPLNWLSLLDVLRLFGRHWAAHPEQIQRLALRLAGEECLTISPAGRDDLASAA
jgi:UDP-GlcNAc:undecaprenyl-phosphate GlcNAc-1-phosphate transferase